MLKVWNKYFLELCSLPGKLATEALFPKIEVKGVGAFNFFTPISQWTGGKPQGNIQLVNQYYYFIRHRGKIIKTINILNQESSQQAFILAKKNLYGYCKENNLLRNEYRYCEDDDGPYLEVTASNTTFTCDVESIPIVEEFLWRHITRDDIIFTEIINENKSESIYFHRMIIDIHGKPEKVIHRDGNKRNNRKHNLIII